MPVAWLLRLSVLVRLISDSILVGFKAGAGLTIVMTQLPSLFGVAGGGHNFFERAMLLAGQLGQIHLLVLAVGAVALALLLLGERLLPGKPVGLAVVALSIIVASVFGLPALGVPTTGEVPAGLPSLAGPALRLHDVEGIIPLAAGCLLLAYIEGISAARAFAAKHGYPLDPRQEFLGLGAANLAAALGHGYPVAGGLSQSAVNDKAGARTPLALVIASATLALCLLFLTGVLANLPKAVLAAVVLTAVSGLVDCRRCAIMARQPDRFLRGRDRARGGAVSRHPAGHPARDGGLGADAAGARVAAACGVPRARAWHPELFRYGPSSRERAACPRARLPSRSLAALRQRRRGVRSGVGASARIVRNPPGRLRPLGLALRRSRGLAHAAPAA